MSHHSQASSDTNRSRPQEQAFIYTKKVFACILPRHIQPSLAV